MNLKGGYKILLLPVMEIDEDSVTITDKGLLEQLSTLKTYMGKKELKPILLHCEIEKDSKITKHCVMGELKKISDTEYVIIGKIDKAYLTISVEFTQDEETGEYYIASGDATYILSETTKVGDLVVDGDIESTGDLSTNGITSKGIANTGGIANIGDVAISGDLDVQGENKGKITANTLQQRHVNWSLSFNAPTITGFTKLNEYCRCEVVNQTFKIVLCARYQNDDTEASANFQLGSGLVLTIPEDIGEKIYDMADKKLTELKPTGKCENVIRMASIGALVYGQNKYVQPIEINHYGVNQINFAHNNNIPVSASNILAISVEVNLTLI